MVIRRMLMIGAAVAAIGAVSVAAVAVAGNGEACGCVPDVVDDRSGCRHAAGAESGGLARRQGRHDHRDAPRERCASIRTPPS